MYHLYGVFFEDFVCKELESGNGFVGGGGSSDEVTSVRSDGERGGVNGKGGVKRSHSVYGVTGSDMEIALDSQFCR